MANPKSIRPCGLSTLRDRPTHPAHSQRPGVEALGVAGIVLAAASGAFWMFPKPYVRGLEAVGLIPTREGLEVERLYYSLRYVDALEPLAVTGLLVFLCASYAARYRRR